jgi:signal transduction histidine kinase
MDMLKARASHRMDILFRTGYPHPMNLFAALVLTLLPLLSPFAQAEGTVGRPTLSNGLAGLLALAYLVVWSQLRVFNPGRTTRFYWVYLLAQTVVVSLIYALDGGLTRFLFVVVAVQAVYMQPWRRWAPFLGTVAALWLTLYLLLAPAGSGASMVATIGMYFLYLLFAAFVTFTTVQQERQNDVAQELLEGVDQRHHILRAYDLTIGHRAESEERERLAKTILATLLVRLGALSVHLERLRSGELVLDRPAGRAARLEAKEVLGAIREAVRTLRPGEDGEELEDEDDNRFGVSPQPEITMKWTDPIRLYHVWNIGVIVITTGVMVASLLVGGTRAWGTILTAGLALLSAYGLGALAKQPWSRTLWLVVQSGLIIWMAATAREPLMNHLWLIVAAQMVFLVPPVNRWLVMAVLFPSALSGAALWLTDLFRQHVQILLTLTAAFGIMNFFGAVMAFMTKRQVEARERALLYAEQLAEVNRLLEARLQEIRRMAIAGERVRMAREIHDGLGHHLTIVIMELQYVEQLAGEDPAAALPHIESAQKVIRTATGASREMFATLERFDRPLPLALRDLVEDWCKGGGPAVRLRISGDFASLSTAARITLYRAVQESLTNIQKHARAGHVEITLQQLPDRVALSVVNDDSGGCDVAEAGRGGFGLVGLKERADSLQGELSASARPGGGFEVKLVLPLGA